MQIAQYIRQPALSNLLRRPFCQVTTLLQYVTQATTPSKMFSITDVFTALVIEQLLRSAGSSAFWSKIGESFELGYIYNVFVQTFSRLSSRTNHEQRTSFVWLRCLLSTNNWVVFCVLEKKELADITNLYTQQKRPVPKRFSVQTQSLCQNELYNVTECVSSKAEMLVILRECTVSTNEASRERDNLRRRKWWSKNVSKVKSEQYKIFDWSTNRWWILQYWGRYL